MTTAYAVLFALFVWWFSTGAIFWAISRGAGARAVAWTAPLAVLAGVALVDAAQGAGPWAAVAGFCAAIAVWGWFELAFLTGVLTGPVQRPCPPGLSGAQHFLMAWGTVAHHEIALLLTAIVLGAAAWGAPDQTGVETFLLLFAARISAKLNVYFGVPNLSHEMLPRAVAHLKSYFAVRRMNWVFPLSVTALTCAVLHWAEAALATGAVGAVLLSALAALALAEHWLMVLPVRDAALWQWMTRRADGKAGQTPRNDPMGGT